MPYALRGLTEYKKHLVKFFQFASNNSDLYQHVPRIAISASQILTKLVGSNDRQWSFSISPLWEIPIEDPDQFGDYQASLLVGGIVYVEDSALTNHSFSVCVSLYSPSLEDTQRASHMNFDSAEGDYPLSCCGRMFQDKKRIARRFHFDIDCETKSDKPTFHLQYGGKPSRNLLKDDIHYCLDPFIENPRIPYSPVNIVLLLDMLLREFDTPMGSKLIKEKDWKGLVRMSEKLLLKDYYVRMNSYFNESGGPTLCESLYGENA